MFITFEVESVGNKEDYYYSTPKSPSFIKVKIPIKNNQ